MREELFCDAYGLTMAQQALTCGMGGRWGWFELYFRHIPEKGGFAIAAGLEPVLQELEHFGFSDETIAFLRKQSEFTPAFLTYLRQLHFISDVYAVPEGTPIFPGEPLLQLHAPLPLAYLLETRLVQKLGYATLIATKANRMVRAAKGRPVWELGARRAHGVDAAIEGARAAYLGGCVGTSCMAAQRRYDVPVSGTMGHAFVQQFPTEYEAFSTWCKNSTSRDVTLLVDTYDTLHSGVPNAIRAFQKVLLPRGITNFAVRLDSGHLAPLSKQVRKQLDEAGLYTCRIFASSALDEYRIQNLLEQDAKIDVFGVGERLITARQEPVLGCVMKLTALDQKNDTLLPKYKRSESRGKSTLPYPKQIWRCYSARGSLAVEDWLSCREETPDAIFADTIIRYAQVKPLLHEVMHHGMRTSTPPILSEQRAYTAQQVQKLPNALLQLSESEPYPLHLSSQLVEKCHTLWQTKEF